MLTREAVLEAVKGGRESECLDGRDYARLTDFFPTGDYEAFGFKLKDGVEPQPVKPWTEEAVREQLKADLEFAFEKALDKRGISASMMYEVVKMWLWVLEDELALVDDEEVYPQYGLPLLKRVALKYGFENPIGDDNGNEDKYSSEGE